MRQRGETTDGDSRAGALELTVDPVQYVLPSVADVSSHPEPRRAFPPVSPLVERGHRHPEVVGEVLHAEKPIRGLHVGILGVDAFNPVAETLSSTLQLPHLVPGAQSSIMFTR